VSARRARKRDKGQEAPSSEGASPAPEAETPPAASLHGPSAPPGTAERSAPDADVADPERLRASLQAMQAQNSTLRQLVAIHDRLGGLVLQGADVAAITSLLSELVGRRVLLLDAGMETVAISGARESESPAADWSPSEAYVNRILRTLVDDRRPLRVPPLVAFGVDVGCVVTPIVVGDAILGYLVMLEGGSEERQAGSEGELNILVVQHAATVYALAMMRERMAAEVTRQLRNELLEGLLLGHLSDPEEVRRRAARVGFAPGRAHHVIVMSPEDTGTPLHDAAAEARRAVVRRRRLLDGLAELIESREPDAVVSPQHDELVVIVPASDDPRRGPKELGRAAIAHASTLFSSWSLTVGIGGPCQEPTEVATCYGQARRAVEAAQRFGRRGEVVAFEDLGLYRLLFQVANPAELDGFVEQVLGELIAYDSRHQADFVLTLDSFLRNNASPQATARELAVHVNTVSYRLQRIRTISGLNLDQAEDRLLAGVALKIIAGTGSAR
jgi:sugar diacid utilization regulator